MHKTSLIIAKIVFCSSWKICFFSKDRASNGKTEGSHDLCQLLYDVSYIEEKVVFKIRRLSVSKDILYGCGPTWAEMYLIIMIRTDTFLQNKCIPVLLLRHTNKAQWCSATKEINAVEACQKYYRTYHTGSICALTF